MTDSVRRRGPRWLAAGDSGLRLLFDGSGDRVADTILAAMAALDRRRPAGVADVVPGYDGLLVIFDPRRIGRAAVRRWAAARVTAATVVRAGGARGGGAGRASRSGATTAGRPSVVRIAVAYDVAGARAELAADAASGAAPDRRPRSTISPDLGALARRLGVDPVEVVRRHVAPEYRVALVGFRPGFPYLEGLDPSLATPRLPTPRAHVASGSVAIGGTMTGIYPSDGPGGWQIIGRTAARLFDPTARRPFLLGPGDRVRFVVDDASVPGLDRAARSPAP